MFNIQIPIKKKFYIVYFKLKKKKISALQDIVLNLFFSIKYMYL